MKVLILAEQCNPEWASLPHFSYQLAMAIAKKIDIVLVTHIRGKSGIESNLPLDNVEVIYIDNEFIAKPLYIFGQLLKNIKLGGLMTDMALKYPSYIFFEYLAYKKLKTRLQSNEFDLVQRISPVSPTLPSPFSKWCKLPFIYGPINGALPWPKEAGEAAGKERELISFIRDIYKIFPYYRASFKYSVQILAAFDHIKKDIPNKYHNKIIKYDELGVDSDVYKPLDVEKYSEKCRFLFVGRLVPYKSADIAIKAFAESSFLTQHHELIIVGDGDEMPYLESLISSYGVSDSIKLVGWKSQLEVAETMKASDVFVFPTIREVGGNVIVEALSSGLPCVVPDYGGPGELVDSECGFKIPLSNKEKFIDDYRECMEKLANDQGLREKLSKAARQKVLNKYSWDVKAEKLINIYQSILSNRNKDQ